MASQLTPHQQHSQAGTFDGNAIVHERQDSEKDLMALFDTLVMGNKQLPMRERKLPPSFFSPSTANSSIVPSAGNSTIGHHSREGSADSSYSSQSSSMQSPHHFRSVSAPVVPSKMSEEPLPQGWQMAVTAQGQKYFLNHYTRTTTWADPRISKPYQQLTPQQQHQHQQQQQQQQQRVAAASSKAPFFSAPGASLGQSGDGMQMDASSPLMQQLVQQQQLQQQQPPPPMPPHEQYRQRSTSWIDPRTAGTARYQYTQRQAIQVAQARQRMLLQQQQQQQHQKDLLNSSGMVDEAGVSGGISGNQFAPQMSAGQRDLLPSDPFMPVSGSVSPDMALQFNAPSPANSGLSHVREGSTDSGFGLGGVESSLSHAGHMDGGQLDPMVGNPGLFSSFANHSMSPIPSVGSPRPASAASGSFMRHTVAAGQQHNDISAMMGLDAGLSAPVGLPMETDDLSAMLSDGDFLNHMSELDNDPMLIQTLL